MRRHHPGFCFLVQNKISLSKFEEIAAPTPVSQLVVAGHQTPSPSCMSESTSATSTNGYTLEHQAMQMIHSVHSEPVAAASEAKQKRRQRSAAELQAVNE